MLTLAQRCIPNRNHQPTIQWRAYVGPTLLCYLGYMFIGPMRFRKVLGIRPLEAPGGVLSRLFQEFDWNMTSLKPLVRFWSQWSPMGGDKNLYLKRIWPPEGWAKWGSNSAKSFNDLFSEITGQILMKLGFVSSPYKLTNTLMWLGGLCTSLILIALLIGNLYFLEGSPTSARFQVRSQTKISYLLW